jgi:putative aldouronate transport system permease protein
VGFRCTSEAHELSAERIIDRRRQRPQGTIVRRDVIIPGGGPDVACHAADGVVDGVDAGHSIKHMKKPTLLHQFAVHRYLVLLMIPGIAYFIIFRYLPIYGITIAFKEFVISKGILGSPWVGLRYFQRFFQMQTVGVVFLNTIKISVLQILFGFPAPILLALLMNELRSQGYKRVVQSISYLPYFLSWVVVAGFLADLLSPSYGPYGFIIKLLGGTPKVLLSSTTWFVPILIISAVWKNIGWGTIVYLAAMSSINPEQYEAAIIDGAGRFRQVIHITVPGIASVVSIMFILTMGGILNAGFDQVFNLYNPLVYPVADIIDTFIYRIGMGSGMAGYDYSLATAVGLTKNVIAFILVLGTNMIFRRFSEYALW